MPCVMFAPMAEPRTKRYLLRATALSVGGLLVGCGSRQDNEPPVMPPGNPKGSVYDDAATIPPDAQEPDAPVDAPPDAEVPDAPPDAGPQQQPPKLPKPKSGRDRIPPPGNPKGSLYDDGAFPPRK